MHLCWGNPVYFFPNTFSKFMQCMTISAVHFVFQTIPQMKTHCTRSRKRGVPTLPTNNSINKHVTYYGHAVTYSYRLCAPLLSPVETDRSISFYVNSGINLFKIRLVFPSSSYYQQKNGPIIRLALIPHQIPTFES